MSADADLVSVIIPVYNGESYLSEAVESVYAQTVRPLEVIVIDDGSTDGSAAVARSFEDVRFYRQPNRGAAAARNRGAVLAHGRFLAFLDADDVWTPQKLRIQMAALLEKPELDMVFGRVEQFSSPELGDARRFARVDRSMKGLHVGALLIRRASFHRVGLFHADLTAGEFIDWYAKAMDLGLKQIVLPEVVMKRRLHANNLMQRHANAPADYLRILRSVVKRRHGEQPK